MDNKYINYTLSELAQDDDFIRWIKDPEPDLIRHWENWLKTNPDQKEKVENARILVESLSFKQNTLTVSREKLWDRIEKDISETPAVQKRSGKVRRMVLFSVVAAAVLGFFIIFRFTGTQYEQVKTGTAENKVHQLPDGSIAHLNAVSRLYINEKDWKKKRAVILSGEAFFDIEKGDPLTVQTDQGTVTVLGTSFNVFSRGEEFRVKCLTGKVSVSTSRALNVILTPGEQVSLLGNGVLDESTFDAQQPIDWTVGEFRFRETQLRQVFDTIERQFGVSIRSNDATIESMLYTGMFKEGELEKALYDVTWPMKLKTSADGNIITISRLE